MEQHVDLRELLKRVACFSTLDDVAVRLLKEKMRVVSFAPEEVVCAEGEPGDNMYIVKSGELRVMKATQAGQSVEIEVLRPGDFGGVMSLFTQEPRSATLQAKGDVELWVLDHATFQTLLEGSPALANAMLAFMTHHLRDESLIVARLRTMEKADGLRIAVFDSKSYSKAIFTECNRHAYALTFFEHRLTPDTVASAMGFDVACAFVNDTVNAAVVERLKEMGVGLIAMRCAGYNNVDLAACERCGVSVVRVPAYSPQSVAEHSIALIMALNRRTHRAHARVREGNFSLDGLVGFEVHGKTVGIVGTGRIGCCAVNILLGFGCRVLAYDKFPNKDLEKRAGVTYTDLDILLRESDIVSLYLPLLPDTHHLIDEAAIAKMKRGVMIINTSRGGLVDAQALVDGLKTGQIGSAGLDVYEEESEYFFEDFSDAVITDDVLARLMSLNNVLITSHMAFLTQEALRSIADTTFDNIKEYEEGKQGADLTNGVCTKCG